MTAPLRFVHAPVVHRAKRIPEEIWEQHRDEICRLYLAPMKLEDVMIIMHLEYDFVATQRQYTHQLGRWGVRKYNIPDQQAPAIKSQISKLSVLEYSTVAPNEQFMTEESLKRPRSEASLVESTAVGASHPSKKGKIAEVIESKSTVSEHHAGTEENPNGGADDSENSCTRPVSVEPLDEKPTSTASCNLKPDNNQTLSPSFSAIDEPTNSGVSNEAITPEKRTRSLKSGVPDFESNAMLSEQDVNSEQIPAFRRIDCYQPVDMLSKEDVDDLRRAADYFAVFSHNREAFELYITVLKRYVSDPTYRNCSYWYLIIQCVHTATKEGHMDIIRNILREELDRHRDPAYNYGSSTFRFIIYMLTAFTCNRLADKKGVEKNMAHALSYLERDKESMMAHLPSSDRSLDLVYFRNILRLHATCDFMVSDLFYATSYVQTLSFLHPPLTNLAEFEDQILYLVPGPFEVQLNSKMANPCIRSCLTWCEHELRDIVESKLPWRSNDGNKVHKMTSASAEASVLFIGLWERWCESLTSRKGQETEPEDSETDDSPTSLAPGDIWMVKTQQRMGINPSELLYIICSTIQGYGNRIGKPAQSECEIVSRLHDGVISLLGESDISLARKVLRWYIKRNTETAREPAAETALPQWRRAIRDKERDQVVDCLEKALMLNFTNLGVVPRALVNSMVFSTDDLNFMQKKVSSAQSNHLTPTLASSLSSIDLSIFRKTQENVDKRLRELRRMSSCPSSSNSVEVAYTEINDISSSLRSMSLISE